MFLFCSSVDGAGRCDRRRARSRNRCCPRHCRGGCRCHVAGLCNEWIGYSPFGVQHETFPYHDLVVVQRGLRLNKHSKMQVHLIDMTCSSTRNSGARSRTCFLRNTGAIAENVGSVSCLILWIRESILIWFRGSGVAPEDPT